MTEEGLAPEPNTPGALRAPFRGRRDRDLSDVAAADLIAELLERSLSDRPLHGNAEATAMLAMALEARSTFESSSRFSIPFLRDLFHSYRTVGSEYSPPPPGHHLELGVGSINPLASGMVHLLHGSDRVTLVDLQPPRRVDFAVRGALRVLLWMLVDPAVFTPDGDSAPTREQVLERSRGFDLGRMFVGDPGGVDPARLDLVVGAAESLTVEDSSVDTVASNSFLEHVTDLDAVLRELARVTRPGSRSLHGVDFRDHRVYRDASVDPLEFLTEAPDVAMVRGTNRLRLGSVLSAFERAGFDVHHVEQVERRVPDASLRDRLVEPWLSASDEDLACLDAKIVVDRR